MDSRTEKQITGQIGEDIAKKFLVKHGFSIIERNFRLKVGEIDLICERGGRITFVEVKTVSRENISRETSLIDEHRPEDNVHPMKLQRMMRAISVYLERNFVDEPEWDISVVAIILDRSSKTARVRYIPDIA